MTAVLAVLAPLCVLLAPSAATAVPSSTSSAGAHPELRSLAGAPALLVVDRSSVPATWNTQFSDPAMVSFSATTSRTSMSASATGLPAGLAVSAGSSPWTISGTPTAAPGSYPATVSVTDGTDTVSFDVTVVVAAEDSTVSYTGPTSVVGPDPDADEVPVTMTALVTQAADGHLGAVNAATVEFTDTDSGTALCPAAPVATSGTGPGTASCTFDADLSEDWEVTYHVALTVGGSYVGSAGATAVFIALPDDPDPVPPDTTITSGPSGWLLATQATFGLASSLPDSTYICRLDTVKVPCEGASVTVSGLTQRAHRLSVVAVDDDDNRDESAATRDFAVPVDDAGLTTSGKWRRKHLGSAYLGTYSQAKRKGAALTYRVSDVRELALLVRTGKKYGAVKVYLDDDLLAILKTGGPAGSKALRVAHFSSARSGTVRVVTTSGAMVRVDGLGVSTYPFCPWCRPRAGRVLPMRLGMTLPVMEPDLWSGPDTLERWARAVDEGPFASLCFGERLAFDNPETLTLLGAAAAWTSRVRLVTTVIVPQLHEPAPLAKALATADRLSGGRLTVGLGIGGRVEDYRAASSDAPQTFGEMARRVGELKRVWAGEKLTEATLPVGPPPYQPGGPPLLVGTMGPRTVRSAAAWADGLAGFSLDLDVAAVSSLYDVARSAWADAGRPPPLLTTSFWVALADSPSGVPDARAQVHRHLRHYMNWLPPALVDAMAPTTGFAGTASDLRDLLLRLEDAGTDEVHVIPTSSDLSLVDRVAELAEHPRSSHTS